jgi:hypothetical protein
MLQWVYAQKVKGSRKNRKYIGALKTELDKSLSRIIEKPSKKRKRKATK